MSDFQRFAIYYLPDDRALAAFGARWLGWDVEAGAAVAHPSVEGIEGFTATPRKYGFHGTLKPPFRLADGTDADGLADDLTRFAARTAPVQIDGLELSKIGKFLALVPEGDTAALADLAFACVRDFDHFRRPAEAAELELRRASGLTPRQDALLLEWGYPYVADEFRFHLTLTGKLDPADQATAFEAVQSHLPDLPRPYHISSVALAGERADGRFQLIHRYALTG
jgi:putative phosphonate metabolism protein